MERGTYLPDAVSEKKVSKDPSAATSAAAAISGSGRPSGFNPCSIRYLQQEEPHGSMLILRCRLTTNGGGSRGFYEQFPSIVSQLYTSLTNVNMADLRSED